MKVLYLDFLYPEGHIRQNTTYIRCLSQIAKVYVLCPKGRYTRLPPEVEIIEKDSLAIKDGKILARLSSLKIMLLSAITARKLKPDYIFVSSYETMMFAIGRLFFRKKDRLFLLHHSNIDELENKVKRCFFKSYVKKPEHIVFEDFIRDYLINTYKLDACRVHVLPHQLNMNKQENSEDNIYSCVGLSNSNDEEIISKIIDIEKKQEIFLKSKCKVVLRSKLTEFDNGYLTVIKGFLNEDVYNHYINNSRCIYMPFPKSFRNRMSGTLVDALSNNKIVFGSNIPLMQHYASKYPSICKIVNSADDLFEHILSIKTIVEDKQIDDFVQFKAAHSEDKIKDVLKNIFEVKE